MYKDCCQGQSIEALLLHTLNILPKMYIAAKGDCWCPRHQCCSGSARRMSTSSSLSHSKFNIIQVRTSVLGDVLSRSWDATGWYVIEFSAGTPTFCAPSDFIDAYGSIRTPFPLELNWNTAVDPQTGIVINAIGLMSTARRAKHVFYNESNDDDQEILT